MTTKWPEGELKVEAIAEDQDTSDELLAEVAGLLYKMSSQYDDSKSPSKSQDTLKLHNNSVVDEELDCA